MNVNVDRFSSRRNPQRRRNSESPPSPLVDSECRNRSVNQRRVCPRRSQEEARSAHGAALTELHGQLAESQAAAAAASERARGSAAEVDQAAALIDGLEQRVEALQELLGAHQYGCRFLGSMEVRFLTTTRISCITVSPPSFGLL